MKSTVAQAISLAWAEADGLVKRRLALALLLVLATAGLAALAPVALKYAVDGLGSAEQGLFEPASYVAFYIVGLWISRSLGEARWFFFGTADQRLHRRLSRRLLKHVIDLPLSFHLDRKTGALNQTLVQGLAGYRVLLNHTVFTVLPVLIEVLAVGMVLLFLFEGPFLLILGLSIVAYSAVFAFGAGRIIGPSRKVSATQIAAYANMTDSLLNAETVKSFAAEGEINRRYDTALAESERRWSTFYWRKTESGLLVAAVFALSLGAAMIFGVQRVQAGSISVGDFVLVNAYMLQIVRPLETLGAAFRDIAYGVAFIEKMMKLMGQKNERSRVSVIQGGRRGHAGTGHLQVRRVDFSYSNGHRVLENVDFDVEPGKTLAIVGKSGSGKSSLVRLLMRFYDPDRGEIYLNGEPVSHMALEGVRRAIAIVPQDTVLFNDTVAYNIGFGRLGSGTSEIEQAARIAHIHDRIMVMPDGYQTVVGERGLKLSGGEKQRVSIARAVLKRPQIFIFDEATSSLDAKTELAILDNLIEVSRGMTTLIVSHRLSTVVHADEILVLEHGRIIERGRHETLLGKNGAYAALWNTQHGQGRNVTIEKRESA